MLEDKLRLLPTNPGVYVMLDKDNHVIYVGKAKNLKNRVRQYFFNGVKTDKVMAMVSNVYDFYYIIAPSEIDALSLENNLIKKYKPRYNILLKDDKTYPYLRINLKEPYPTFSITRKIKKDGAKYFGPFMGGISVKEVLGIINLAFLIRPCDKKLSTEKPIKPCLNSHIGKCLAPCAFAVSQQEYLERVNSAIRFLSGEVAETERLLKEKMFALAEMEEFELALRYKENLLSLEKLKLKRVTSLNKDLNADIIAFDSNGIYYAINLLIVRNGRMIGSKNFAFENSLFSDEEAILEFVKRYYNKDSEFPSEIITKFDIPESKTIEEFFKSQYGAQTVFVCTKQGVRKQLCDMAEVNAKEHLEIGQTRIKHKEDMTVSAGKRLKELLSLSKYPRRMECYDISNISGVDKVGSMVVFTDCEPDRNEYRRFKIKTFEGADDYRSHQEMMERRLERLFSDEERFSKPDLMIIDGGKGQLSAVMEIIKKHNITDIDVIALAERDEEIFLPNKSEPIVLDKRDYCLKLLQRIRDEAHRFAITYHRSLRSKRQLSSILDSISGLGKVKKKALLDRFKDIGGIISATEEELILVKGIGEREAKRIIEKLTEEGLK